MLHRLPIRARVTLAFTAVMAVVLAATGFFIYLRQGHELQRTVDQGLQSRVLDIAALVRESDSGLAERGRSPLTERGESVAQILTPRGRVVDGSPGLRARPLLGRRTVARAAREPVYAERRTVPPSGDETRLLATPVRVRGRPLVVVAGASMEGREQSQHSLGALLALGGLVALVGAAAAGFGVVTAALAPMEAMRRRAAEIQTAESGDRLPVPEARDEVQRLGLTLNSMLERLEEAFARERRFVSDASHELRTPLAILKAELEVALLTDGTREDLRASIGSAAEESDRLSELAEDLLVIARSDHGELQVRREPVEVGGLLEDVRRRFSLRAAEHGVELHIDDPGERTITADPLRLEQALGNLVDNALRHGGGTVTLAAEAGTAGALVLHVRDSGPGFSEGFAAYAFERFTREDPARGRGGAGLGLAIVEAIAHAHGGTVHAANAPGGGADVSIEIPALTPAPAAPAPL